MLFNLKQPIRYYDNSLFWALFLFINSNLFYLAPVKLYVDANVFIATQIKIFMLIVIMLMASRNAIILLRHPMVLLMIFISAIFLIFTKDNLITIAMPVIIGIALFRVNINNFLYKYFLITNFFWILYLLIFIFFYEIVTTYDSWSAERVVFGGVEKVSRGGIGFVSPNNIGGAIITSAIISFMIKKNKIGVIYLIFSIITFFYTDSRSILISAILLSGFCMINVIWKNSERINLLVFYSIILGLVCLGLFTYLGILDQFKYIDRLLSHRIHYLHLILIPSFFGSVVPHSLDTSLMDVLNKGGIFAFSIYIFVMNHLVKIDKQVFYLVIGFLLLGLSENIINQYNALAPIIFLLYLRQKNKALFEKESN
jgi:hypothetical protein